MKNSFYLVIPPPQNDPQALMSYSETALQQWLEDIPAGNPGLSTRLLQDRIAELISLDMPVLQRLSALEVLRPYCLRVEDALRSRLSNNRFPKNDTEQKIAHWLLLIEKQYTIGYWMVVQDLTRRTIAWQFQKPAILAMHRTVKGLSSLVLSHFLLGYRLPDWIWYDVHALYQLAVKHDKHAVAVNDASDRLSKPTTIEQLYRQLLLMSLVGPTGLMQRELLPVYHFVGSVVQHLQISPTPVSSMPQQCVLTLDEDLPPRFVTDSDAVMRRNDSLRCFLDLTRLGQLAMHTTRYASALSDRFNPKVDPLDEQNVLSIELFNHVLKCWQGVPHHGSELFADRLDRLITIGLDATHEVLADEESLNKIECSVETRSSYALCLEHPSEGQLSVGSLLSLRKASDPPHLRSLGVVSALQANPVGSGLVFEVNALADRCYDVSYRTEQENSHEPLKALLYILGEGEDIRSYLLLESFLIKEDDIMMLYMADESFPIILKQRRNVGLGYWQFECRRILDEANATSAKKKVYDFT